MNTLSLTALLSVSHTMEFLLEEGVNFSVIVLEFMGLVVIITTALKAFYGWVKRDPRTSLNLAEGLAMALEFKLGGEILRTVVARDMSDIIQVGAIIILRAALTFLIHWEIKNEEESVGKEESESKTK